MFAHHQLGGIAQFVAVFAFARGLREMPRRLGNGGKAQPARRADDVLGQARGFIPFFLGAGLRQRIGQLLGGDDVALQDFDQRLDADGFLQGAEGDRIDRRGDLPVRRMRASSSAAAGGSSMVR